jgi:hypothetical protein
MSPSLLHLAARAAGVPLRPLPIAALQVQTEVRLSGQRERRRQQRRQIQRHLREPHVRREPLLAQKVPPLHSCRAWLFPEARGSPPRRDLPPPRHHPRIPPLVDEALQRPPLRAQEAYALQRQPLQAREHDGLRRPQRALHLRHQGLQLQQLCAHKGKESM